jgi:psiF repeat-containing protein
MRALVTMMVIGLFVAAPVHAVEKKLTPQQQKMSSCAKENKGKTGDAYKQGMSDCMHRDVAAAPAAAPQTQQQKMAACARENKGKKGDEYKQAMSACLAK